MLDGIGCIDCGYLDKSRKNVHNELNYQYGCNHRGLDKFMCGWCSSDKDLKSSYLGCSDWIPKQEETRTDNNQLQGQMSISDWLGGSN